MQARDVLRIFHEIRRSSSPRPLTMHDFNPSSPTEIVFLLDVDNTLLDTDLITTELREHLIERIGQENAIIYWAIFEALREELGYADYLGALQRYRNQHPHHRGLMTISRFLINYPFANRLFPQALETIHHLSQWGPTVILSDGDVVFQPHKVERSGIYDAVERRAMIYVHKEKELDHLASVFPAAHYVVVDDKLRILTAIKNIWRDQVTTIFVRQGHYAHDPGISRYPNADRTIDHIADLLSAHLQDFKPTPAAGSITRS